MSMQNTGSSSSHWLSCTDGVATAWQDFLLLVARVMFGLIFIIYGWEHLMDIPAFAQTMPRRDLPIFLGYVSPFVEFIGGVLLVLGFGTRYAALVLLLFMIVATFSSHRYWNYPAAQQGNQMAHFWKNIAMIGGNVVLFVTGGGRFAVDRMLVRK